MVKALKSFMAEFYFASEAEIFSSDLRFRMFGEVTDNRYKCNLPLKNEEMMSRLKGKLTRVI